MLSLAMRVAESSEARMQHGAVVTKGGRVIAIGYNKVKNHPTVIGDDHEITLSCGPHAEVDALSRVKDAKGATIYIARVRRDGRAGMSKPCDNCQSTIDKAGIKKIVYTIDGMVL